jgi:3-polyprenyl-4-hydroxybenzoate decarboxylase
MQQILDELDNNQNKQTSWDNIYSGSDYINAVQSGKIGTNDMVLMVCSSIKAKSPIVGVRVACFSLS